MRDSLYSRRAFLKQSVIASLGLYLQACAPSRLQIDTSQWALEEIPDFSDENVIRHVAGIRPYREKQIRLEATEVGGKNIIHNYGHGGAGYTVAWGCAEIAAEWAAAKASAREPVAVLGAGVIGLSTARVLQERGYSVNIYAKAFSPRVTSDLAGAQWSPSSIAYGDTNEEKRLFSEILIRSYRRYERMDGCRYGIRTRLNYVAEGWGGPLDTVPSGLIPPVQHLERLPFPGAPHRGDLFRTFLIEPPIYMPALVHDVRGAGAKFKTSEFMSADDIQKLSEKTVLNCMGLGSGAVFSDSLLKPIRGHLVHLKTKSELPYLLLHEGYVFPRRDAIVLGGTWEEGVSDPTPNLLTGQKILELNRRFFTGES